MIALRGARRRVVVPADRELCSRLRAQRVPVRCRAWLSGGASVPQRAVPARTTHRRRRGVWHCGVRPDPAVLYRRTQPAALHRSRRYLPRRCGAVRRRRGLSDGRPVLRRRRLAVLRPQLQGPRVPRWRGLPIDGAELLQCHGIGMGRVLGGQLLTRRADCARTAQAARRLHDDVAVMSGGAAVDP